MTSSQNRTEEEGQQSPSLEKKFSENEWVEIYSVEELPGCRVQFTVLPRAAFKEKMHDQAFNEVRREVAVPGFRRGKAPVHLVKERYSKEIAKQWRQQLEIGGLKEALKLLDIRPNFNVDSSSKPSSNTIEESDWHVVYRVEKQLSYFLPKKEQLKELTFFLPSPPQMNAEPIVPALLNNLKLQVAEWEEIADRTVEKDQFVTVTISSESETLLSVEKKTPEKFPPAICELLQTMTPGEQRNIVVDEELAGYLNCPVNDSVTLTLEKSYKALLPDDDQFLKKIEKNSMEELEEELRGVVHKNFVHLNKKQNREKIREQLCFTCIRELPYSAQLRMAKELEGMTDDKEEMRELFYQTTLNTIWQFILPELVQKYEIPFDFSDQEIKEAAEEIYEEEGEAEVQSMRDKLFSRLTGNHLLELVQANVNIVLEERSELPPPHTHTESCDEGCDHTHHH